MSDPELDQPPAAPSRMRSDFSARMDAFLAYIEQTLVAQLAALVAWINARVAEMAAHAATASAAAASAEASGVIAAAAAEAEPWVAGDYLAGEVAQSQVDFQFYAATTDQVSQTDPALAAAGWEPVSANSKTLRAHAAHEATTAMFF